MRVALGVEYDGHVFHGWQSQEGLECVQSHFESALAKIAVHPIQLFCAGRTDAGVHSTGQVVHFDTTSIRCNDAWVLGTNTHLLSSLRVCWSKTVDDDFHARFSARSRRYRYVIYNNKIRPALLASRVSWQYRPLDVTTMQQAASYFIGEQDFSSFRSSHCESRSPVRTITHLSVERKNEFVIIEIEATAFLHHMVRNIAGVLMKVGAGFQPPSWVQEVLAAKDRRAAAETAPANGLYLIGVGYPEHYGIPTSSTEWFTI